MFLLNKITLATITIVTIISQTQASFSGSGGTYVQGGWNQNQQTRQSFQPWQQQRQQYQPPSPWRNAPYPQQQTRGDNSNSNSNSDSNSGGYVFRRPPQPDPFYQQLPQPDPFYQQLPQPDPFYQQLPQPQPQPLPQPNPFYQIPQPQPPTYVQPDPDAFYDQNQSPTVIQPQPVPVQPPYVPIPDYGVEPAPIIEILKPKEEDPPIVIVNPPTLGTPQIIQSQSPIIPITFRPIKVIDSYPVRKPDPVPDPIPIVTDTPIPGTEAPKYIVKEYYPTTTQEPTTTIDINDIPNRGDSPYSRNGGTDNDLGTSLDDIETGFIVNQPQSLIGSNPDPTTETIPDTPPVIGKDPELDQQILTDVFGSLLNNLLNNQNDAQDATTTTQSPEVKEFIDSLYNNGNPFAMMNAGNANSGPKDPMTRGSLNSNAASNANVGAQGFADRPTGEQYSGPNPFLR